MTDQPNARPTTRRSTIVPTEAHYAAAHDAYDAIRADLGDAVEAGFATARTTDDLSVIVDEQLRLATAALVHAAYARDLIRRRRDALEADPEAAIADPTLYAPRPAGDTGLHAEIADVRAAIRAQREGTR